MYKLVRRGSGYHIMRSVEEAGPSRRTVCTPLAPLNHCWDMDLRTWKKHILSRTVSEEAIRDDISKSWARCTALGVDPSSGKCWDIRQEKELGEEFRLLRELTEDVQTEIFSLVKGSGLLVTVSDQRGYLLSMYGDHRALSAAEKLNFGPGANWSEASVGTNAIGTALASAKPMRVAAREHFCESHHVWICSAAPIFDLHGNVIGCLDISGPTKSNHRDALELAISGAKIIESRLYGAQCMEFNRLAPNLVSTVFNAVMTGLIYLRSDGRIAAINPKAAVLLGAPSEQLFGAAAEQWFELKPVLGAMTIQPQAHAATGLPVPCRLRPGFDARLYPVLSPNGTLAGHLLVVNELQRPRVSAQSGTSHLPDSFHAVIGQSLPFLKAIDTARQVAPTASTVLITGESGTGKEVLARAIHAAGPRRHAPFVAVNCGAIPSELIQTLLFGYVEGAFTGARRGGSPGKFEQASGGTLLLDEIGEMPLSMQINLLRVLEEGQLTRVGGTKPVPVDVRIIAATHQDLEERAKNGEFRYDLFYRLNVIRIHLPPLRERGSDTLLLAQHFIAELAKKLGRTVRQAAPEFYEALNAYHWPGNVRELRHALEAAITLMPGDLLTCETLPDHVRGMKAGPLQGMSSTFNLQRVQEETVRRAHIHFQGNITRMAKALGIGRNTLYAKLREFKIV